MKEIKVQLDIQSEELRKKLKIVDGKDGLDGYTPIKGVDYFDGKDGKDGKKGKDGKDATEVDPLVIKAKILEVGIDYTELKNAPVFKPSSKTTSLIELDDIDYSGLTISNGKYVLGSGPTLFSELEDVDVSGVAIDQSVKWNGTYWIPYTPTDLDQQTLQSVTDFGNTTTNSITALSFVKSGGLSTEFLKADGSIDSNTYLTSILGLDHGSLGDLLADDHTQYALLAGRATPQQFSFGTASGATTGRLSSTAHATKGKYFLNAAGTMTVDDLNVRFGVGTATPETLLHLQTTDNLQMRIKNTTASTFRFDFGQRTDGSSYFYNYNDTGGVYAPFDITANILTFKSGTAGSEAARFDASRNFGVGTGATVSARLHTLSTTEQFRSGYDASNYWSATTNSTGNTTFNAVGTDASFTFSDAILVGYTNPVIAGFGSLPVSIATTRTVSTALTANQILTSFLSVYAPPSNETTYQTQNVRYVFDKQGAFNSRDLINLSVSGGRSNGGITGRYSSIESAITSFANAGNIAVAAHFRAQAPTVTGVGSTITDIYGLYIADQANAGITNAYGVYQLGSTTRNHFAGNVSIGSTTNTVNLDVTSTSNTSDLTNSGIRSYANNRTQYCALGYTGLYSTAAIHLFPVSGANIDLGVTANSAGGVNIANLGGLGATANARLYVTGNPDNTTGTGTVSTTLGGTIITGVGTDFTVKVGQAYTVKVGSNTYAVRSVDSATQITIFGTIAQTISGSAWSYRKPTIYGQNFNQTSFAAINSLGQNHLRDATSPTQIYELTSTRSWLTRVVAANNTRFEIRNDTANVVPFWIDGNTIADTLILNSAGVGIGVAPTHLLDVGSNAWIDSSGYASFAGGTEGVNASGFFGDGANLTGVVAEYLVNTTASGGLDVVNISGYHWTPDGGVIGFASPDTFNTLTDAGLSIGSGTHVLDAGGGVSFVGGVVIVNSFGEFIAGSGSFTVDASGNLDAGGSTIGCNGLYLTGNTNDEFVKAGGGVDSRNFASIEDQQAYFSQTATKTFTAYNNPSASAETFRVGVWAKINSLSAGTLTITVDFTDHTGAAATATFFMQGSTTAALSTTGFKAFPPLIIQGDTNADITVKATFAGASIDFDAGSSIEL
jgi:hypothetical protein